MSRDELKKMIERHAEELGEHFDAVQILASTGAEEGGTSRIFSGSGNWFARQGMAHTFIKCDEADEAAYYFAKAMKEDE